MPRKANAPLPQPLFSEPVFNEGVATPDPTVFKQPHPSDTNTYNQVQNLLKKDVVSFSAPRGKPGDVYTLESALGAHGPAVVQEIQGAGQIVFHAAGDTGASNVRKYGNEISVADVLTNDFHTSAAGNRPAFFYHLGDVVYDFGESQYYYDQFYEPFRNYPAPIFAIPGNHDSFVIPNTPAANTPLSIFTRNFCAAKPVITKEAASLHRTAMTQPGVYFTLDAPFVRIIGLFSNALEDPGVISSQKGQATKWPAVPDLQLAYLTAQLQRIKTEKFAGAVLLSTHHPPFSYKPPTNAGGAGGNHSSSAPMLREIDTICQAQGVYPHAFLSGHAHNYQRYTRKVQFGGKGFEVPFLVCGDGGHNVVPLVQSRGGQTPPDPAIGAQANYLDPQPAVQAGGLVIEKFDHTNYGYLRVTVNKKQIRIEFHPVARPAAHGGVDTVTVDLASHTLV
ncbi:MAG TPA: metallophosphoesterase [Candidatus Acidoferrum sp.]|nr:metallophosphoesterase [Candidatus Limnocylindria bacterium]